MIIAAILILGGAILGITSPAYDGQWVIGMLMIVTGTIVANREAVDPK